MNRKFTSHFYFRADGSLGKRPIIEVDDIGAIVSVREMGDEFKEEAGLAYHPGILCPVFFADFRGVTITEELCKNAYVNGVRRIGVDKPVADSWFKRYGIKAIVMNESTLEFPQASGWSGIMHLMEEGWPFVDALRALTMGFQMKDGCYRFGLSEGADCGLMVIQNIQLKDFSFSNSTSFKVLVS